jgi:hypothetical protein
MPAQSTYTPIATYTAPNGSVNSYSFTSIPQTYTDLVLVLSCGMNSGGDPTVVVNNDSGANYSDTWLNGNGTTLASYRYTGRNFWYPEWNLMGGAYGVFSLQSTFHFMNYSNTSTFKTVLYRTGNAAAGTNVGTEYHVGIWRSTAAITRIDVGATSSQTYMSGSTFTLYGIAAA